ncbi:MAG: hypothetical protein GX224_05545 [Thermoplasmatales archaeon]|nr:hypothetical protein [Thermoplasmatales archaeon]
MAPVFHWAKVRAFSHATEDPETVRGLLTELTGVEEVDVETAEGHHGNPILIMEATLWNSGKINAMYESLGLDILRRASSETEDRLDEDLVFHLRLDKQELAMGNRMLSAGGDTVTVLGKVIAHPAKREVALANLSDFLEKVTRRLARPPASP